jgi:hypothetical protein
MAVFHDHRIPSIKTLMERLKLSLEHAQELRKAMVGGTGLACYNRIAGLHGIERIALPENSPHPDHTISYVNAGDTYGTTLMNVNGRYVVGNWGDLVERWG